MNIQKLLNYILAFLLASGMATTGFAATKKKKIKKKAAAKTESTETGSSEANSAEAEGSDDPTYGEPWGMAGCDLWAGVITSKDRWPQLGVWLLRTVTLNSQTSAISSGTSNCVSSRTDLAAQEQKVFIEINLASLSKEAAQGEGEHLDALAQVFGCPEAQFAKLSQVRYGQIYSQNDPSIVLGNYLEEVKKDKDLSNTCVRAS